MGNRVLEKRFKRSGFKLGDFGWDLRKQDFFFPGLDIVRKHGQFYDGIFLMNTNKARRLEWC